MNHTKILALLITVTLTALSCKDSHSSEKKNAVASLEQHQKDILQELKDEKAVLVKANVTPEQQINNWNTVAKNILKFRTEKSSKSWAIIDVGVWEYKFSFANGTMTKAGELDGKWIDYNQDLTYEYGYYDKVEGKGRFHYDLDSGLMLMVDDDPSKAPHEYKIKTVNDVLILQGMTTYGDAGMQAKLEKVMERPKK